MTMTVQITRTLTIEVQSFAAASEAIRAYWDTKSHRTFYASKDVGVITIDGTPVAHVSYNGRVWSGTDRFGSGKKEIK